LSKPLNKKILEEIPSFSKSFEQDLDDKTTFENISSIKLFISNQIFYKKIIKLF
jgi:hypothetical protein